MAQVKISGENNNFCTFESLGEDDEASAAAASTEFKDLIKNNTLVVVDFYAQWCGPCKTIAPKFKEMSKDFPTVKFVKIDVDDFETIASDNDISCMPTFLFFKNGEKIHTLSGANADKLRAKIDELK